MLGLRNNDEGSRVPSSQLYFNIACGKIVVKVPMDLYTSMRRVESFQTPLTCSVGIPVQSPPVRSTSMYMEVDSYKDFNEVSKSDSSVHKP